MPDKGAVKQKRIDLGASGSVILHLSPDQRSLWITFDARPEGLDKTGVNTLIDALKKVRDKMRR